MCFGPCVECPYVFDFSSPSIVSFFTVFCYNCYVINAFYLFLCFIYVKYVAFITNCVCKGATLNFDDCSFIYPAISYWSGTLCLRVLRNRLVFVLNNSDCYIWEHSNQGRDNGGLCNHRRYKPHLWMKCNNSDHWNLLTYHFRTVTSGSFCLGGN